MTGTQRKNLDKLLSGNAADVFDAAVFFDSIGMFILPGESAAAFAARAERMICEIDSLGAGTSKYMEFCKGAESIDNSICEAAVGIAEKAYGFRADWVPALKSGRRAGLLSEGILYEIDGVLPLVFIKNPNGRNAAAVLAHEICHAARMGFGESVYDEWFPRNVEPSLFRRIFGNFFRDWKIPSIFFASAMAAVCLFAVGLPLWGMVAAVPMAATIAIEARNRAVLAEARKKLAEVGLAPLPILFRMDDEEIFSIAKSESPKEWVSRAAEKSLRWKIFLARFSA